MMTTMQALDKSVRRHICLNSVILPLFSPKYQVNIAITIITFNIGTPDICY